MHSLIKLLAWKLGIPKTQFTYQMIPKKKEGVAPSPGKAQCSSFGDYQDREVGRCGLGNRGGKRAYGTFMEGGSRKGKIT